MDKETGFIARNVMGKSNVKGEGKLKKQ